MLLLSVLCTVFGSYTIDIKKKKIKYILVAYCLAVHTVIKLPEKEYCFVSVTYELAESICIIMVTSYCIRYTIDEGIVSNIYKTIDFADRSLERIGVRRSQKRKQSECAAWCVATVLMLTLFTIFPVPNAQVRRVYRLFGEVYSLYYISTRFASSYSRIMLLLQFIRCV